MTLSDLKTYFRTLIKVVPGGPPVGTAGSNRAAGTLAALDKLAEFAADQAAQSIPFTYTIQPADATSPASDIVLAIPEALSFGAVYIEVPGVTGMDRLAPSNYSGAPGQLTLSASISPALQAGYKVHVYYQEGSVQAAGVTAAQLATVATTLPRTAKRTADYTLQLADAGSVVPTAGSGAVAVTFPANATVALPVDSSGYIRRTGTGGVNLVAAAGVQFLPPGVSLNLADYGEVSWHKVDLNTFWLKGDLI